MDTGGTYVLYNQFNNPLCKSVYSAALHTILHCSFIPNAIKPFLSLRLVMDGNIRIT